MINRETYKKIAEKLRREEKIVESFITSCSTRYAYAETCAAMRAGADAIDVLLESVPDHFQQLPSSSLLIGPEEFLVALFQESDSVSLPLHQIDAFAQFLKYCYAAGRAFSEYEIVGLDIELPAVIRAVQRRPDRFSMSSDEIRLITPLYLPVNPELSRMGNDFLTRRFE